MVTLAVRPVRISHSRKALRLFSRGSRASFKSSERKLGISEAQIESVVEPDGSARARYAAGRKIEMSRHGWSSWVLKHQDTRGIRPVDLAPAHDNAALTRAFQSCNQPEQGRFAAAAGAEECDEFTGIHGNVDRIEHAQRLFVQLN
jgi:hypothetical protein